MTDDKEENYDKLKDFVLRDIYYNQSTGFQNQKRTYESAKKRLSDISLDYVKDWFQRQKSTQLKPYMGFNSYIVDRPNIEVQADLADSRNAIYNRGYGYIYLWQLMRLASSLTLFPCSPRMPLNALKP